MTEDRDRVERPRAEPEIIPPGHDLRRPRWDRVQDRIDDELGGTQRIYITRLGPLGGGLLLLGLLLLGLIVILAIVGAFLIWLPVVALALIVAYLAGVLRWGRR